MGASAADVGRAFQTGMFLGEKLLLKHFVLVEVCWNFKGWFDIVLVHPWDKCHSEGKSMKSFMISNWAEVNYESDMFPFPLTHPSLTFFPCNKCRALTIGAVKHDYNSTSNPCFQNYFIYGLLFLLQDLLNRTADITRSTVQKSVCVISRLVRGNEILLFTPLF